MCLRKGIRFQRYVKYKAKIEPNFGGGEKRIRFGGKVEDMEAVVLVAEGRAPPRVLGAFLEVHGLRVAGAEGVGKGEVSGEEGQVCLQAGGLRCFVGGGCCRAGGDQPTPQHDNHPPPRRPWVPDRGRERRLGGVLPRPHPHTGRPRGTPLRRAGRVSGGVVRRGSPRTGGG